MNIKQLNEELKKVLKEAYDEDMDTAFFMREDDEFSYVSAFVDGNGFDTLDDAIEDFKNFQKENYAKDLYKGVKFSEFRPDDSNDNDDNAIGKVDVGEMDVYFIEYDEDSCY